MKNQRILTGDRPTGQLHLGHLVGTLQNRVLLQDQYECFFIIADLQVFTDHLKDFGSIKANIFEVMCDYLGVGLEEEGNTFFIQSQVPELTELSAYFSFLVNVSRLERNPTIKSEAKAYGVENMSLGFLGYPVSQAADILAFKADLIPVGKDQVPHIEQSREIARDFNRTYGCNVFHEPKALVGDVPVLVGTDGNNKMSKSLNNFVALAHSKKETTERILKMVTDTKRVRLSDVGHPNECFCFSYWKIFSPSGCDQIREDCEKAKIGCLDCKRKLAEKINENIFLISTSRNNLLTPFSKEKGVFELTVF